MAKPSEFTLFLQYGKEVKKYLKNNLYLDRYPEDENVNVFYASPPRAFVKFIVPVINGSTINPVVTFYLAGMEYAQGENLLGFVKETSVSGNTYTEQFAPLIFKLTYKVNIFTSNEIDADILQYQALAKAPVNRPHAFGIDGQWGTLTAANPSNDTDIQPGEVQDKVSKRSLDLVIPRAYLPVEYVQSRGIIEEINLAYETAINFD